MATADLAESSPSKGTTGKPGAGRLQCVIVTPERIVLDELVEFVALPIYDGELGVLPGRAPLVGRLGYGELRLKTGGTTRRFFVDGGFAQVRDNVVSVLTGRAEAAESLQLDTIRHELDAAQNAPANNEVERADRSRKVARARARLAVASRRG